MNAISSRLKDALWSIRRQVGLEPTIDRVMPLVAFEKNITRDQLNQLLIDYPERVPDDLKAALTARIQEIIRHYWFYQQNGKGFFRVQTGVFFLENVARYGLKGCYLHSNPHTGFRLKLIPGLGLSKKK